jgi:hypothetical protein
LLSCGAAGGAKAVRSSCQAEIGFDLLPRNRRFSGRFHLGACRCGGPDVSHVLGKLEDLIKSSAPMTACHATASAAGWIRACSSGTRSMRRFARSCRSVEGDLSRRPSTVCRMNQADVDARIWDYYSAHFAQSERLTLRSARGRVEFERVQELIALSHPSAPSCPG